MTTKITTITVGRLFNTGNYENMRYEVQISVEDGDIDGAFSMARSTIEAQHARFLAEREEAARQEQEAWRARRQQRDPRSSSR